MLRLGGVGAVMPFAARAQRSAMPVVGYLSNGSREAFAPYVDAFLGGLREAGIDVPQSLSGRADEVIE